MVSQDNYSVVKVIEQYARCIDFQYNSIAVSTKDRQLLSFVFTAQFCIGVDLRLDSINLSRTYIPFLKRNTDLDIIEFGTFLKRVDGVIKNYTEHSQEGPIWTYERFKHACSCDKTYWDFIAPIRSTIVQYLSQPDPQSFRIINQWLNFCQRCNVKSLDLTTTLIEKYTSFEHSMSEWQYPVEVVEDIADIISEWCKTFTITEDFVPKHGPGSIAGRKGRPCIGEKYQSMGIDNRLNFLSKYIGSVPTYSPFPLTSLTRCSDLVFVPKSLITQRTISKEPASLQYFQQGVARSLLHAMAESDARRHIDLEHQEYSRTLAQKGSIAGKYATIDLSDASDSVSVALVKQIFRQAELRNALICCRSDRTRIEWTGEELVLSKFAPMGASTCFPVETLVFAACCELACRRSKVRSAYYRVYGDDIIIDETAVDMLLDVLGSLHFQVNISKSFWKRSKHNFREACGGEYFDGVDVAPLRIPRKLVYYDHLMISSANAVIAYTSLANQAFDFGYTTFRSYVLDQLKRMNKYVYLNLPYSEDGKVGLTTWNDCCTNFRIPQRHSLNYQRHEVHALIGISVTDQRKMRRIRPESFDERIRLFEWYRLSASRSPEINPVFETSETVDIRPKTTKLRGKWITV